MELTKEQLNTIADRLTNLASECHFMYDSAKLSSFLIGTYDKSSYMVECHIQDVLRRADNLLDDLHCVSATLDGLLIQHKVLDDAEMI